MKRETLPLWETDIPCPVDGDKIPTITYYASDCKNGKGTVVIFPGGGYHILAPHEGDGYAKFLNEHGYDAFVVTYRLNPIHFPAQLLDARRAVRFVRANAEKYGIDPNKIAVMGSSAGGHLAALVSTYRGALEGEKDELDQVDYLPNGTILCYPVLNGTEDGIRHLGSFIGLLGEDRLDQVAAFSPDLIADEKTPPAFLWHTAEDKGVNVINSYRYATRLRELNIPAELHVFPFGPHGLGLCNEERRKQPYDAIWGDLLIRWLGLMGW